MRDAVTTDAAPDQKPAVVVEGLFAVTLDEAREAREGTLPRYFA